MDITLIISLVVFLGVLYFLFKFVKSLVKTLVMGLVALLVILAAAGFLVMSDVRDLKQNFSNSTKLMLFATEDELRFGVEVTTLELEGMNIISSSQMDEWQDSYSRKRYNKIAGEDYYKLFILKNEAFEDPIGSPDEFKSALDDYFSEGSTLFLLREYREGNLVIYPETPVFKLVKIVPKKWVEKMTGVFSNDRGDAEAIEEEG